MFHKVVCPICLASLEKHTVDDHRTDLVCTECRNRYYLIDGLPVFLVKDENWEVKSEEIEGEAQYNVKHIPMEVHIERNAFVDRNTEAFLSKTSVDLSGKELLVIGASMAELEFWYSKSHKVTCLDIVPSLTKECLRTCLERGINATWLCGDGECLPFETENFDFVIVRQSLHHMQKYYSAISEFFRTCRIGGSVMIIDEYYTSFNFKDILSFFLEKINKMEKTIKFIAGNKSEPLSLLADKYLNFSLLNCIQAIRMHTTDFHLSWPKEIAWSDESGDVVKFCHGPNPNCNAPLAKKLIVSGYVSILANKIHKTTCMRNRDELRAIPFDILRSMLPI